MDTVHYMGDHKMIKRIVNSMYDVFAVTGLGVGISLVMLGPALLFSVIFGMGPIQSLVAGFVFWVIVDAFRSPSQGAKVWK